MIGRHAFTLLGHDRSRDVADADRPGGFELRQRNSFAVDRQMILEVLRFLVENGATGAASSSGP